MVYLASIFLPLFLAPVAIYEKKFAKYLTLGYFVALFYLSITIFQQVGDGYLFLGEFLNVEKFGFALTLQVDKLASIMLLLTSSILILVVMSSWNQNETYFSLLLLFSGAIFGVFLTTNLLWFFIFWELTLVPIFFLVGIWGAENRIYASIKFFLYTHFASMLMIVGFFLLFQNFGTFELTLMSESNIENSQLIWWLLLLGILVKIPVFPFHTWLPDAHVQAPSPISVVLAGILLKMGAYAFIKFIIILFPETSSQYSGVILGFGIATLFFAGILAIYVTHVKKLIAYSSISHMGLVMIAVSTLTVEGLSSAVYQMIAHAFVISPLFLIAGYFHHKTGSWEMKDMGGIMQKAPLVSTIFVFSGLASLGLPGTMGFVGELTVFVSAISHWGYMLAILALGSIVSAGYFIWTFRRVIYGEISPVVAKIEWKMGIMEKISLILFSLVILIFGLYPQPIFDSIKGVF
jgi:NADH-quinone oxidoreductase subunit M